MTVVIFDKDTYQIMNVQSGLTAEFSPEEQTAYYFSATGLERSQYVCRRIPENLTLLEFKESKQIVEGVIVDRSSTLDELKAVKLTELSWKFNSLLTDATSSYTTQGLPTQLTVNARERDLNNAQNLKALMLENSLVVCQFRCYDNTSVQLTLTELGQLISELRAYGLSMYQKKWALEQQVGAATSPEELAAIVW